MKNFEVTIYNEEVRHCIRNYRPHPNFDDGWADQRFIQIEARDMDDARKVAGRKYPERRGFVIVEILEMPEYF